MPDARLSVIFKSSVCQIFETESQTARLALADLCIGKEKKGQNDFFPFLFCYIDL